MELKEVNFKTPNLKALNKEGFLCVDMHCHTHHSDGALLKEILEKAKKNGIGLAITDHNEIEGALEALRQDEVPIIPGIEINCMDGPHILCYFYDKKELQKFYMKEIEYYKMKIRRRKVFKAEIIKRDTFEIVKAAKKYNCIVTLAHPYGLFHQNFEKALLKNPKVREAVENVDAIEVVTSTQRKISNRRSYALKLLFDKAMTAGSDAHTVYDVGSAVSCAKVKDAKTFLDSIKLKKNIIVGRESIRKKAAFTGGMVKRGGRAIKNSLLAKVNNLKSRI
ncbi:PHP domain-containing protein [Candidatus Woesearchaeota archaeon]|nr:PHP domain-containing protein [Candidatus Woesearchaeota archaeon]